MEVEVDVEQVVEVAPVAQIQEPEKKEEAEAVVQEVKEEV